MMISSWGTRILPGLLGDWSSRGARFYRKIAHESVFKRESCVHFWTTNPAFLYQLLSSDTFKPRKVQEPLPSSTFNRKQRNRRFNLPQNSMILHSFSTILPSKSPPINPRNIFIRLIRATSELFLPLSAFYFLLKTTIKIILALKIPIFSLPFMTASNRFIPFILSN
jgi:hypothetical protein